MSSGALRNQKCFCGSGLKFKRCHQILEEGWVRNAEGKLLCMHPPEIKKKFVVVDKKPYWECSRCGYRSEAKGYEEVKKEVLDEVSNESTATEVDQKQDTGVTQ